MTRLTHESILQAGPYQGLSLAGADPNVALRLHSFMTRLRRCEEALAREYHPADEMRCPVHFCIGQEAVPAALSVALTEQDYLFCHHRSHGYYLAKGAPMDAMFAELYGKATGANGGKAGSQDISFAGKNFYSGAILAGAIAIAVGAAAGFKLRGEARVAVAGFGESATDEGLFWEAVSYAALRRLPVVFVCENNNYSVFSPQYKRQPADNLSERVASFRVRSQALFGNDVLKVHASLSEAVDAARAGQGPSFIEAYTYRWSGHYGPESDDLVGYRDEAEVQAWKRNCPIALLENELLSRGLLTEADKRGLEDSIANEIAKAFEFAKTSAFPEPQPWAAMNCRAETPLADELLADLDWHAFDESQSVVQAKGY